MGSMPWWVNSGSQDEPINSSNLTQIDWVGEHQKSDGIGSPEKDKQGVFHLSFSAGENKNSLKENDALDLQTNNFPQFLSPHQKNYIELGLGQPMVYANYSHVDQCHGFFAVHGAQPTGRVMLPFTLTTEDGPIYVNPKQYHGILRRRKMRAKEGMKNRSTKDKPYIHESRHRHACRRARGAGGRFLNTKNFENNKVKPETKKTSANQLTFLSSQSSSSEVLQSEGRHLNCSKEVSDCKSSNFSSSEVTSMYYSKEFDCFGLNPSRPFAFHALPNLEESRQGGNGNWVAAANSCCNLFKA
ncbi:unnamed protein product [Amaranthus hypochondriacus]